MFSKHLFLSVHICRFTNSAFYFFFHVNLSLTFDFFLYIRPDFENWLINGTYQIYMSNSGIHTFSQTVFNKIPSGPSHQVIKDMGKVICLSKVLLWPYYHSSENLTVFNIFRLTTLWEIKKCYYSCFTDGELRHRDAK